MLTITVLGCGGSEGVPKIGGADGRGEWGACDPAEPRNRRTRPSILVESPGGARILVDAGPDLRAQLLACGIGRVDAVLLTHAHADHIMGLDEMRALNRALGAAIPVFATEETLGTVRGAFGYAFHPPGAGFFRPALVAHRVAAGETVEIAGLPVRLFRQDHKVMDTLGLRIGGFAYSTDVVELPEPGFEALAGLHTWIVGCMQRRRHAVHAHLDKVAGWAERLRPRRTVLTHMGPDLDWAWMRASLPPGIEPAHDGLVLEAPF